MSLWIIFSAEQMENNGDKKFIEYNERSVFKLEGAYLFQQTEHLNPIGNFYLVQPIVPFGEHF